MYIVISGLEISKNKMKDDLDNFFQSLFEKTGFRGKIDFSPGD